MTESRPLLGSPASDTLRRAADALHLASLRQAECPASGPGLDEIELLATLLAVAATCGPCRPTLVVVDCDD